MNILFIGNSFTYFNGMPSMVEKIGLTNGQDIYVEHITYGGFSLIQYLDERTPESNQVMDALNKKKWDYVVLQEQSSKPDVNKSEFLSSVETFNTLITNRGAKPCLYSTWSYKVDSKKLHNTGRTYTEFYNLLTNAYIEAENTYGILRAPIGTIFYNITMEEPSINLIMDDDFHPNLSGSYIAAYTFYTKFFGFENNNEYLPIGLSKSRASTLRRYILETLKTVN